MKKRLQYAWVVAVFAMLISGAGSGVFISTLLGVGVCACLLLSNRLAERNHYAAEH